VLYPSNIKPSAKRLNYTLMRVSRKPTRKHSGVISCKTPTNDNALCKRCPLGSGSFALVFPWLLPRFSVAKYHCAECFCCPRWGQMAEPYTNVMAYCLGFSHNGLLLPKILGGSTLPIPFWLNSHYAPRTVKLSIPIFCQIFDFLSMALHGQTE